MTDQANNIGQEIPASAAGVGVRLRTARESRQLSIDEVASQLRLPVRHLDALEHEDLGRLPDASYVCGYLRAYAKFLELPSNEIVENFPGVREHVQSVKSTVMPTKLATPREEALPANRDPWLGGAIVLFLALLGVWMLVQVTDWWNGAGEDIAQSSSSEVATPADEGNVPTTPESTALPALTAPVDTAANPLTNPSAGADVIAALPPATPISDLVVEFSGDSWVEVHDASDRRLVYGLGKAGQARAVKGQAPFRVVLGATQYVQIRFNGTTLDMTPYRQREAAAFRIGTADDNRIEGGGE